MRAMRTDWPGVVPALIALLALVAGVAIYGLGRDWSDVYLLAWAAAASQPGPAVELGGWAGSAPSFLHAFGFALLTAVLLGAGRAGLACFLWAACDTLLELLQHPAVSALLPPLPAQVAAFPVFENLPAYAQRGRFDLLDIAAVWLGALAAYLLARAMLPLGRASRRRIPLLVVSVAGLIGVVGSGGGGGGGGGVPPAPANYLPLTADNAADIATVVIETVTSTLDLADIGSVGLIGGAADAASFALDKAALEPLSKGESIVSIQAAVGPITESCLVSGTLTLSGDVASPDFLSVGDRITVSFSQCDDGDGVVLNGRLELVIREILGDVLGLNYLLRTTVNLSAFAVTEAGETTSATGSFELTTDNRSVPVLVTRVEGVSLAITAEGDTRTLLSFSERALTNITGLPYTYAFMAVGALASQVLDGRVDYETITDLSGPVGDSPTSGELLITGLDNATVRVVIIDAMTVQLEIDSNGDGQIDDVQTTTWEALGGVTAPGVTDANAELLIREALAAVNQAELAFRDAGAQFGPNGGAFWNALNLVTQIGTFGPVSPRCVLSNGFVSVSGELAVLGTFTPGDVFSGTFSNCLLFLDPLPSGPPSNLTGDLVAEVTAYSGMTSVYDVTFDASFARFQGAFGVATIAYQRPDLNAFFQATSPQLEVRGGTGVRAVLNAAYTYELSAFSSPARITRGLDAVLYTAAVPGRYIFATTTPWVSDGDNDPATGPDIGEFSVTADNATSVTVVAVDKATARLDIDVDGNGSTDVSRNVSWLTLQQ